MKKGLFSKIVAAFILVVTLTFIILAASLSAWLQNYYFKVKKQDIIRGVNAIKSYAINYLQLGNNGSNMKDVLTYTKEFYKADVILVDNLGFLTDLSIESNKALKEHQFDIISQDLDKLKSNGIVEHKGQFGNVYKSPVYTLEVPIFSDNGSFVGAIIVNSPLEETKAPLKDIYLIIWLNAILGVILSSIVIYNLSQKIIIKPLEKINYVAGKIAKGEVDKRVEIKSSDEIGQLVESFNSMAVSIEEMEKHRREFVSNVSHEIRSPMTSIKGFIGGILDGVIPPEKQNYYLSLTYEEVQRLTRLINDLLDLSAIDSGKLNMRLEEVNINEIIRLTAIKSEEKIKSRRIKLEVLFSEDNLFVIADRDRITQVITNLLDNSLKYGQEGGNVKIATKNRGNKVYVSIYNDGPNIDPEDLKHIWDRFYKAEKSRTTKTSTGLGLPIVRSILTQLGEDILVENRDVGVVFTFTLKKA